MAGMARAVDTRSIRPPKKALVYQRAERAAISAPPAANRTHDLNDSPRPDPPAWQLLSAFFTAAPGPLLHEPAVEQQVAVTVGDVAGLCAALDRLHRRLRQ